MIRLVHHTLECGVVFQGFQDTHTGPPLAESSGINHKKTKRGAPNKALLLTSAVAIMGCKAVVHTNITQFIVHHQSPVMCSQIGRRRAPLQRLPVLKPLFLQYHPWSCSTHHADARCSRRRTHELRQNHGALRFSRRWPYFIFPTAVGQGSNRKDDNQPLLACGKSTIPHLCTYLK